MTSTWREILEQIETRQSEARGQGNLIWYRGQRVATWPVKSTVHRRVEQDLDACQESLPEPEKIGLMRAVSKTLFHKFKARGWQLLGPQERSDWGIVFAMQHYGVPTRLIDWTENFVCALYFAQRRRSRSDDAAIFILAPQKLNQKTIGQEGLLALGGGVDVATRVNVTSYHPGCVSSGDDLETLAVAPVLSNSRMLAQRSTFTLSGAPFQPIEEGYPNCVKKIVLPAETFDEAERFLGMAGQGHFGYFPDLDGLRQELVDAMDREVAAARGVYPRGAA